MRSMGFLMAAVATASAFPALSAVPALDLADPAVRARQPQFERPSYACGVEDSDWADGRWCYRFHVTKAWMGALPQWPSVNLVPTVKDWTPYDRLVVDVFNDAPGGDVLCCFIAGPEGRIQNGLSGPARPLADYGFHRWVINLKWPATTDPKNIARVHFFFTTPSFADVHLSGFHLLKKGETLPPVSEKFFAERVRPAELRAEKLRKERRQASLDGFRARCRAGGQTGDPAWFGQATSMEKVCPRGSCDVSPAKSFDLRLARGERESLQVLVMPNGKDLKGVTVEASADGIDPKAFKTSVVGYVKTVNPPPYKCGYNISTNLPGGYLRATRAAEVGWWPDPILDYLEKTDVADEDLQGFWVRLTCPENQKAGVYKGRIRVTGEGWEKSFPLTVRVYGFSVPKKSPLPLAITFAPGPHLQFATDEDLALAKKVRGDPESPINAWKRHETEWGDFLADYYITMDSLYHGGVASIHWDVLLRLKRQGRLGLFNFGYWSYPADMKPETVEAWRRAIHARFDPVYAKAKELGLLEHAYLYGCDEIRPELFDNVAFALDELKKSYPGVPLFTTAYDHDFGTGASKLAKMDWFTPLTPKYAENFAKVAPSRAAGHQVWWYICCGPHAPCANMFVECPALEGRMLMGAQTVKWRPDGFLYYQISIWNALRPISGASAFTDWEPRSWTRYHGDGSWFCCGPGGRPCGTIRMENFRDGLEDFAYALEYEKRTGRTCEVPASVCRGIDQFTDDPKAYYVWRNGIAEAIEAAGKEDCAASSEPRIALELPPGAGNPRNSEGDFAALKDGSVLFVYTHYTQGTGGDHDPAHLCSRISRDGGQTWSANDELVIENEGKMNVMSVSLLRLKDGALAIFYLLKNSEADCRPVMRVSHDEGKTWSAAVKCVPDSEIEYYVLNNGRATQLANGRIVLPLCIHSPKRGNVPADWFGRLVCWFSDDGGKTWRRGSEPFATLDAAGNRVATQEPGVLELTDGRVMMHARTDHGRHWFYYSSDGCETWSAGRPSPLMGPCGPATLKRLSNGDVLAVWNDHTYRPQLSGRDGSWGTRVPMSSAISRDDCRTWTNQRTVDGRTGDWYCYFAVMEHKGNVLCGYCAKNGLRHSRITTVPISWLYGEDAKPKPSCFARIKEGPFYALSTEQGTWSAKPGDAEIVNWARGKGVKILGGENKTACLQLPVGTRIGDLELFVERFASAGTYDFKVEGQTPDGTWHGLFSQDSGTGVCRLNPIRPKLPNGEIQTLRFTCSSFGGALITDVEN